jgi:prepilin-type N-terminal cleavage/methylation domain-containing protein
MTNLKGTGAESGFTLIEALVVLTIAAVAFALAPLAINLGRTSLSVAADLEQRASAQRALAALSDRIASAQPIFNTPASGLAELTFAGYPDRLRFVAEFADGPAGGGLYTVDLGLNPSTSKLVISLTPYGAGTDDTYTPHTIELLSTQVLSLRYFGQNPQTGRSEWQSEWTNAARLPDLVELSISTAGDAKSGHSTPSHGPARQSQSIALRMAR